MPRALDLAGQRYGRLTVTGLAVRRPMRWMCVCDCGRAKVVSTNSLRAGVTQSCGCLMRDNAARTRAIVAARHIPRKEKETAEHWRERTRAFYRRHKRAILSRKKRLRKDPALREKFRAYHRKYYKRAVKLKYTFGVSIEQFHAKMAAQGGRCAICGTPKREGGRDLCLDHSHDFDQKDPRGHRGLLCNRCNVMLAMARDEPSVLSAGAFYMNKWNDEIARQDYLAKERKRNAAIGG